MPEIGITEVAAASPWSMGLHGWGQIKDKILEDKSLGSWEVRRGRIVYEVMEVATTVVCSVDCEELEHQKQHRQVNYDANEA